MNVSSVADHTCKSSLTLSHDDFKWGKTQTVLERNLRPRINLPETKMTDSLYID